MQTVPIALVVKLIRHIGIRQLVAHNRHRRFYLTQRATLPLLKAGALQQMLFFAGRSARESDFLQNDALLRGIRSVGFGRRHALFGVQPYFRAQSLKGIKVLTCRMLANDEQRIYRFAGETHRGVWMGIYMDKHIRKTDVLL